VDETTALSTLFLIISESIVFIPFRLISLMFACIYTRGKSPSPSYECISKFSIWQILFSFMTQSPHMRSIFHPLALLNFSGCIMHCETSYLEQPMYLAQELHVSKISMSSSFVALIIEYLSNFISDLLMFFLCLLERFFPLFAFLTALTYVLYVIFLIVLFPFNVKIIFLHISIYTIHHQLFTII